MNTFDGAFQGMAGLKAGYWLWLAAFPDLSTRMDFQLAEGDRVVTFKTLSGTHMGQFYGIPATRRRVKYPFVDILRVIDGKICEYWGVPDLLRMYQQLGVCPEIAYLDRPPDAVEVPV